MRSTTPRQVSFDPAMDRDVAYIQRRGYAKGRTGVIRAALATLRDKLKSEGK